MNLNYDKIRAKVEAGGNHWTSYSDLFLVLSVVFLLLYVVSNLRAGTQSIATQQQLQAARAEVDDLQKQIKTYEVLKDDYVQKGASQEELQVYGELMGKLNLLETEAKDERTALFKKAKDAEEKEQNLNHYQALVKNIINANLVAQSRVKKRDVALEEREQDIAHLSKSVENKESEIARNNRTIAGIEKKLDTQIKEVQYAYRSKKRSKEKLEQAINSLKSESHKKIIALRQENTKYQGQLESAHHDIASKDRDIATKERESQKLVASLNDQQEKYQGAIAELERAHRDSQAKEKKAYDQGMKRGNLSADARVQKEREYAASVERQNQMYNDKVKALNNQLAETTGSIKQIEGKYQGSIANLKQANAGLQKDLQASIAKQNEQRVLAERIKSNFKNAGLSADVDLKTGDVTINFANEYFDTGSADLKTGMRSILEKAIPVYAASLFQDPKVVKKISGVEIVGFASPTYQGKFVNPASLSGDDRAAVNYNMDLSYQRAKSIFEHIFDTQKMQFIHQKDLLPLVKVTGRSYLATEKLQNRGVANQRSATNLAEYCQQFDCKKSQRVIIKFNLRDE